MDNFYSNPYTYVQVRNLGFHMENLQDILAYDVIGRVNEGVKVSGAMNRLWKFMSLGVNIKRMMHEKIVVPSVLYGADTLGLKEREQKRLNVMEIKCLRGICGVTRMDKISNEEIRRRSSVQNKLSGKVENCVLRWFGYV